MATLCCDISSESFAIHPFYITILLIGESCSGFQTQPQVLCGVVYRLPVCLSGS